MWVVPHRTPWTVGGTLESRAEPQPPAQGRLEPQAVLEPSPRVAADCFSEHLPWDGTVEVRAEGRQALGWGYWRRGRAGDSQGHVQKVILGGKYEGLQVVDPTHQEKACEGEELRPGAGPRRSCPILHGSREGKSCLASSSRTHRALIGQIPDSVLTNNKEPWMLGVTPCSVQLARSIMAAS